MSGDLSVDKMMLAEIRLLRQDFGELRDEVRADFRDARERSEQQAADIANRHNAFDARLRVVEIALARHAAEPRRDKRRDRVISIGAGGGAGAAITVLLEWLKSQLVK